MKQLFQAMLRAMDAGENLVLASVVRTAGSTPRGPGAHMLWSASGPLWGTVGGGPGEAQAMAVCRQVLLARAGLTQRFLLGVSDGSPQPPAQTLGGFPPSCPPPSETLGRSSPSCQPSAQALGGSPQPCPPPLETLGGPSPSHQPSAQALGGPSQPHQPSAQTGGSQDDSRGQDVGAVCGGEMWVRFQYIACQDAAIGEAAARAVARLEQRLPCWLLLGPLEGGGLWIWDGQTPPPGVPAADLANRRDPVGLSVRHDPRPRAGYGLPGSSPAHPRPLHRHDGQPPQGGLHAGLSGPAGLCPGGYRPHPHPHRLAHPGRNPRGNRHQHRGPAHPGPRPGLIRPPQSALTAAIRLAAASPSPASIPSPGGHPFLRRPPASHCGGFRRHFPPMPASSCRQPYSPAAIRRCFRCAQGKTFPPKPLPGFLPSAKGGTCSSSGAAGISFP